MGESDELLYLYPIYLLMELYESLKEVLFGA